MNTTVYYDVVSLGGFYLDINTGVLPFDDKGIPIELELRTSRYACLPGGSGVNFTRALHRQDISCIFMGAVGNDPLGQLAERLCEQEGITTELVVVPEARTNIGLSMVGTHGDHVSCTFGNANQMLTAQTVLPLLDKWLSKATYLYLGTLLKLDGLANEYDKLVALARAKGVKIIVDHGRLASGLDAERFEQVKAVVRTADYYLPSRHEFIQTWKVDTIEAGLLMLATEAPNLTVVVKDGSRGAHYVENGKVVSVPPCTATSAENITGAGDTFNAGFVSGIMKGLSLNYATEQGHRMAADHVSKKV